MDEELIRKVRDIVHESVLPLPDSFHSDDDLFHEGLESMALMQLILALERELHVTISPEDLGRENFSTLSGIARLVSRKSP